MTSHFFHPDQIIKQEQYRDYLREVQHYRLIEAVAQPGPNRLQRPDLALRRMIAWLIRHVPSPEPMNRARI
jgi:hypothetical protein